METDDLYRVLSALVDQVWGDTEADVIRHSEARAYFLDRIFKHFYDQRLFTAWNIHTGVYQSALGLRKAILRVRELHDAGAPALTITLAQSHALSCKAEFLDALSTRGVETVPGIAREYVKKELGVSWDWLIVEMIRMWIAALAGWATDEQYVREFRYVTHDPPAPNVEYHFENKPGETFPSMLARFKEETSLFLKEQTDQYKTQNPKGILRKDQNVKRYVDWFFRLRIIGETVRHISLHDADGKRLPIPHERKDVIHYAGVAERWLSLGFTRENLEKYVSGNGGTDDPPPGEVDV